MCRSIQPLFNFEPETSEEEVRAAALQFVRKISGYNKPSAANTEVFDQAVVEITEAAQRMLGGLTTKTPPKNREVEAAKRKAKNLLRFQK